MFGIIYVTVNKINGKKYIGQHKCSDESDNYLGSGKVLLAAIEKYGRENFKRYTLYVAETKEELDEKEVEFISLFNATHRDDYYNINEGGNANRMCGENNTMYGRRGELAPGYGRVYTEEEKEIMRQRILGEKNPMYGKHLTEEHKEKISNSLSGEKHWHYGQHWNDETKEKISNANKGRPGWAKGKIRTPEHCKHISEGKKGKKLNLSDEVRQKLSENLIERNHSDKFRQQVSSANKRCHERGIRRGAKPVVCIETNIVYASAYDAARAVGCGLSSISACLCGACKTVKGFHWRMATEEETKMDMVYVS